jgi:SAM-dependent methyltransferase
MAQRAMTIQCFHVHHGNLGCLRKFRISIRYYYFELLTFHRKIRSTHDFQFETWSHHSLVLPLGKLKRKIDMTSNKRKRGRKIMALLLSRVSGLSLSDALVSLSDVHFCREWSSSELRPAVTRLLPCSRSRLYTIPGIANNAIIDRQDFLADAFWLTTSSSTVIASMAGTSTMDTLPTTTATTKDAEFICQNGALLGEAAIPGAYSSACMGLSERIVPLPRYRENMATIIAKQMGSKSGDNIQSNQTGGLQPGTIVVQQKEGSSDSTGMTVWNSGLLLTRLLDAMVDELQRRQRQRGGESSNEMKFDTDNDNSFWRNQDVIELGCGTGLCSIAAHRLGAKSVVATDGNPGVVQLAEANIRKNCYDNNYCDGATVTDPTSKPAVPGDRVSTIRVESFQWGFLNAMDYSEGASFVIGADLTYNPGSWAALAETISTVLKTENDNINSGTGATPISDRCYALYLSVGHDGFNVSAELDGFLSVAKEKGLINLPDGVEGIDLNELLQRTLSDPEKKILAQGGGFRVVVLGRKNADSYKINPMTC